MPRVLVIHDDPRTIERIQRHLGQHEPAWELTIASTHADARKAIVEWAPDAVAALARPPVLDGVLLLSQVRDLRPETVRVVLGSDALAEQNLRALRLAHRGLPEPVDPSALAEILGRMMLLSSVVTQPGVRELLGRIGRLPAVPSVYARLSARLEDPNASVFELSQMVSLDSTLAAQVLRMANSAYFGRHRQVTKIEAASSRLGTRLLRSLVLTAEVYGRFPVSPFMADRLETMQTHASRVARIASSLEPSGSSRDDAFTAGLLHDIGKLLLAAQLPQDHESIVREAERDGRPEHEVEMQRLGVHHGMLGACLLGMWGLPRVILEAARLHHAGLDRVPQPIDAVSAVTLANQLANAAASGDVELARPWPPGIRNDPRWPAWRDLAHQSGREENAA